jgi:hypothetical protein
MPQFQITAAERWSMKVWYEIDAPIAAEAVQRVKDCDAEPTTHEFLLNEHDDVEEILSVVDDDGQAVDVSQFNQPEPPTPTANIYQRVATETQLRSPPHLNDPLTVNLAWTRLQVMGACWPARSWLKNYSDLREAWEGCHEGCWLYWLLIRLIIPPETG